MLTVIRSVAHAIDTFLGWLLRPLVLLIRGLIIAWAWAAWAVARAWEPVGRYGWHVVVLSVIVYKVGGRIGRWRAAADVDVVPVVQLMT